MLVERRWKRRACGAKHARCVRQAQAARSTCVRACTENGTLSNTATGTDGWGAGNSAAPLKIPRSHQHLRPTRLFGGGEMPANPRNHWKRLSASQLPSA
jgi:hypothetical protein